MPEPRKKTGISNRETPEEEARERREHPAVAPDAPPDGLAGDADLRDRQLSNKAGIRSNAQKEAGTRHTEDAAPSTHKVAGAFGKEDREG